MIWAIAGRQALLRYGPALAIIVVIFVAGWIIDRRAYDRGYGARDAELRAETEQRQAAFDDLAAKLRARAEEMERERQNLADLERTLADESSHDPMAGSSGLSLDSLRRLNRIR